MGTKNTTGRRKEADPIRRRMYLLGKIEGKKAMLLKALETLPADKGEKDIDAMISAAFAPAKKSKA